MLTDHFEWDEEKGQYALVSENGKFYLKTQEERIVNYVKSEQATIESRWNGFRAIDFYLSSVSSKASFGVANEWIPFILP